MVKICVDNSLSNSSLYEHRCLENIKYIYQSYGKCGDQQHYKSILEYDMVSTSDFFLKIPMSSGPYMSIKQPKARKSLHRFATTLDVKPNTDVRSLCAGKSKHKAILSGSQLWSENFKDTGPYKN